MRSMAMIVAGALMIVAALAHGLTGWPPMAAALAAVGAGSDLVGALEIGWYWGSVAFVGFGAIAIQGGTRLRRGDPSGVPAVRVVAACFLAFGIGAFVTRDLNPHFLLFVALGLAAGAPTVGLGERAV